MFPTDCPGMTLYRNVDFYINLETETRLISIPPYRMATIELREANSQIQETNI